VLFGWYLSFVQRCVGEVLAGEEDVKKGERCFLGVLPGCCGWYVQRCVGEVLAG
jgi:hypothetical protein